LFFSLVPEWKGIIIYCFSLANFHVNFQVALLNAHIRSFDNSHASWLEWGYNSKKKNAFNGRWILKYWLLLWFTFGEKNVPSLQYTKWLTWMADQLVWLREIYIVLLLFLNVKSNMYIFMSSFIFLACNTMGRIGHYLDWLIIISMFDWSLQNVYLTKNVLLVTKSQFSQRHSYRPILQFYSWHNDGTERMCLKQSISFVDESYLVTTTHYLFTFIKMNWFCAQWVTHWLLSALCWL